MNARKLSLEKATVEQVILLAHALNEKADTIFPPTEGPTKFSPDEEAKLAELEASPEYTAMKQFLAELRPQEMRELQALMYLGRGDFEVSRFWEDCSALRMHKDSAVEASHVMSKGRLIDYLSNGFEKLNRGRLV